LEIPRTFQVVILKYSVIPKFLLFTFSSFVFGLSVRLVLCEFNHFTHVGWQSTLRLQSGGPDKGKGVPML